MPKQPPKTAAKQTAKTTAKQTAKTPSKNLGRVRSDFPKRTLKDAIEVAQAIEENNSGNPMPPTDVVIALEISPGSSDWRVLSSAAFKYGLTTGSYISERMALTELGIRVVAPTSSEDRMNALLEAAMIPPAFKSIFTMFRGKKLPQATFFENTVVREMAVPKSHAAACVKVFTENASFIGLTRNTSTGDWLGTEPSGSSAIDTPVDDDHLDEDVEDVEDEGSPAHPPVTPPAQKDKRNAVFVGHGQNKKPLVQLEKILSEYKIPFKVAVEEANQGRPISSKVADIMNQCGAAILIFTADEEFKTPGGDPIWRPNENVVYELGAASVLYGGRIIIFKETGVTFPSNFSDIGHIEFEKDALDAKGMDLFRELIAFQIVEFNVPA